MRSSGHSWIPSCQSQELTDQVDFSGQELLEMRVKTKPKPLALIDDGRINRFSCHGEALKTIPNSISKLNVIWATKQLEKIEERKRRKVEYENKKKKR
jgi:hypothetical protein